MNATNVRIKETVKDLLKKKKLNYRDLSEGIGISEAAVKKFMVGGDLTIDRIEKIALWFGYNLIEFLQLVVSDRQKSYEFQENQEAFFLKNPEALYMVFLLGAGFTISEIQKRSGWDQQKISKLLNSLESLGLLQTKPKKKIILLYRGPFRLNPYGAIVKKYVPKFLYRMYELSLNDFSTPSSLIRSELYLNSKLHESMLIELRQIHDKYKNLSKLAQEQFSMVDLKPYATVIFSKQFDIWRDLLLGNRE